MKKIGIISIVATATLFATPVINNLITTQTNKVTTDTEITTSTVHQGGVDIHEDSIVKNLTIIQNSAGNLIEQSTTITDSDVVQGDTKVINSTVANMKVDSDNTISNSEIDSAWEVGQGILLVTDSNASDSTISNTDIKSQNNILDSEIYDDAEVYQSDTDITDGSTVDGLNLVQTNIIENETTVEDISEIEQSWTKVEASDLSNLTQTVENIVSDSGLSLSIVEQTTINIVDSTVNNLTTTQNNKTESSTLNSAELTQGNTLIEG
jgi:hypothetical protein